MADCKKLKHCAFFNERMEKMPTIAELYRKRLCHGNSTECALYMLYTFLDERNYNVDDETCKKIETLLHHVVPTEILRVKEIVAGHSKPVNKKQISIAS